MNYTEKIQTIFNERLFEIPDYQRGYSWERKHILDLIEDIEILAPNQEHYTGTLVLHKKKGKQIEDDSGVSYFKYEIVDGQQRLTTLTILIKVITENLDTFDDQHKVSKGLKDKYLFCLIDDNVYPKLRLNGVINEFYISRILENDNDIVNPAQRAEAKLLDARDYIRTYFNKRREILVEHYKDWLISFYKKVLNDLKITIYEVPDTADVGVIFEVMNNRGINMTEMEKVKNFLLYTTSKLQCTPGAKQHLAEQIIQVWTFMNEKMMVNGLTIDEEDQLLRFSWIMAYDYNKKNWQGYAGIKKRFNLKDYIDKNDDLKKQIYKYISTLKKSCIAYCEFQGNLSLMNFNDCDDETKSNIQKFTEKIKRYQTTASFMPIIIAHRIRYPLNYDLYLQLLQTLERFSFRVFRLSEKRNNTGQSKFFKLGNELYFNSKDESQVIELVNTWLLLYNPNEKFRTIVNDELKNWYDWSGIKYLLYEYELSCIERNLIVVAWDIFSKKDKIDSIEHILPQTPTDEYWLTNWTQANIKEYTHDLGNLVLTLDNSSYKNFSFPKKKGSLKSRNRCYAISSLASERELCKFKKWNKQALLERRQMIKNWILSNWHIDELVINENEYIDIEDDE